jgi:hypothetical protein
MIAFPLAIPLAWSTPVTQSSAVTVWLIWRSSDERIPRPPRLR